MPAARVPSPACAAHPTSERYEDRRDENVEVRDKTLVVTGAGRGIGRALALHFARKGARLALLDTNGEDLEETRLACTETGATPRIYLSNVASEDSVLATFAQVAADFGSVDGLINNAGVVRDALL